MFQMSLFVALHYNNEIIMQGFGNGGGGGGVGRKRKSNSEGVDLAQSVHSPKHILHPVEYIVCHLVVSSEVKLCVLLQ